MFDHVYLELLGRNDPIWLEHIFFKGVGCRLSGLKPTSVSSILGYNDELLSWKKSWGYSPGIYAIKTWKRCCHGGFLFKGCSTNLLQQDEVPLPPHQLHPSWFSPTNLPAKGPLPLGEGVVRCDREWGDGNNQTHYARWGLYTINYHRYCKWEIKQAANVW